MNLIDITPKTTDGRILRSSYGRNNQPMSDNPRKAWPYETLRPFSEARGWSDLATPGTLRAIVAADIAVEEAGGGGLRLTEVYRPMRVQAAGRRGYLAWSQAGRPSIGDPGFRQGMKSAYVADPEESGHPAGLSMDLGVYWMSFPGTGVGTDAALSALWDIIRPLGWRPVIREPIIGMSEAWHFDHFGPLEGVRQMFYAHRSDGARYRNAYGNTMRAGHALVGTWERGNAMEAHAQALILLSGAWIGVVDGKPGPMTRKGFKLATGKEWAEGMPAAEAVAALLANPKIVSLLAEL